TALAPFRGPVRRGRPRARAVPPGARVERATRLALGASRGPPGAGRRVQLARSPGVHRRPGAAPHAARGRHTRLGPLVRDTRGARPAPGAAPLPPGVRAADPGLLRAALAPGQGAGELAGRRLSAARPRG